MIDSDIGCLEAEQAVVGALMHLDVLDVAKTLQRLQVEDFTDPQLRTVLHAMGALVRAGTQPDPITIDGELRRTGAATSFRSGTASGVYVAELYRAPHNPGSLEHYLRVVHEHTWRRRVQEAGIRLQQIAGLAGLAAVDQAVIETLAQLSTCRDRWTSEHGPTANPAHLEELNA